MYSIQNVYSPACERLTAERICLNLENVGGEETYYLTNAQLFSYTFLHFCHLRFVNLNYIRLQDSRVCAESLIINSTH